MIHHVHDDAERRSLRLARGFLVAAVVGAALVGAYLALRQAPGRLESWGSGVPLVRIAPPRPAPALHFEDAADKRLTLANFRGEIVLLNIWATWCLPCRREMPALDHLQRDLGGAYFQVVALSIDAGGVTAVKRYFGALGMHALGVYVDPTMRTANTLDITGTPTTFLIDRSGREVGRHVGPAKWDSPGTERFLSSFIAASALPPFTPPTSQARHPGTSMD